MQRTKEHHADHTDAQYPNQNMFQFALAKKIDKVGFRIVIIRHDGREGKEKQGV